MTCGVYQQRLGELLTDALDDDAAAELGAHLEGCAGCQDELQALVTLEGTLLSLERAPQASEPSRPTGLSRGWIAAALAAAIGLGLLLGLGQRVDPLGRLVRGSLTANQAYAAGDRLPGDSELTANSAGLIALGKRAALEVTPGTRLRLKSAQAVQLNRGEATFRVQPGQGRFTVDTPRGTVTVLGTVFRIQIEEPSMSTKGRQAGLAAIVALAVTSGVVLFESNDGHAPSRLEAGEAIVVSQEGVTRLDPEAAAEAEQEVARLQEENVRLEAARTELIANQRRLEARIAQLEEGQQAPPAVPSHEEVEQPVAEQETLPIVFGNHGDLEALREADWATMAAASLEMASLMPELLERLESGEGISTEMRIKLGTENQKLLGLAMAINGKLPTHATGNGEYTHPVVMSNLIAAAMSQEGEPLDEIQRLDLSRLGEDYEREWDQLQASYGPETLAVEKLLDELELKQAFTERTRSPLSPTQLAALGPESIRDKAQLDLFSPALMVAAVAMPIAGESREVIQGRLLSTAATTWGLKESELTGFEPLFGELAGSLPAVGKTTHRGVAELLQAGRLQQALMEELLGLLPLDDTRKARMRDAQTLLVPRLTSAD